jgi:hypothetical protein
MDCVSRSVESHRMLFDGLMPSYAPLSAFGLERLADRGLFRSQLATVAFLNCCQTNREPWQKCGLVNGTGLSDCRGRDAWDRGIGTIISERCNVPEGGQKFE